MIWGNCGRGDGKYLLLIGGQLVARDLLSDISLRFLDDLACFSQRVLFRRGGAPVYMGYSLGRKSSVYSTGFHSFYEHIPLTLEQRKFYKDWGVLVLSLLQKDSGGVLYSFPGQSSSSTQNSYAYLIISPYRNSALHYLPIPTESHETTFLVTPGQSARI